MKNLITTLILAITISSCNKFNDEENAAIHFKKEGIEGEMIRNELEKNEEAKKEELKMDSLYAIMVYKFGFTKADKLMIKMAMNNNFTYDESFEYITNLHNRYIEKKVRANDTQQSGEIRIENISQRKRRILSKSYITEEDLYWLRKNDPNHIYSTRGNDSHLQEISDQNQINE